MPFPTLPTWFGKKASAATKRQPKDRSQLRVGIPKVLNIYSLAPFLRTYLVSEAL